MCSLLCQLVEIKLQFATDIQYYDAEKKNIRDHENVILRSGQIKKINNSYLN